MDTLKVMIVDDQPIMVDTLTAVLTNQEKIMVVDVALNCMEAVEKAKLNQDNIDVILMDLEMPFMDGIKATKIIQESCPKIKILIFTAHDDISLLSKSLEMGASGYLIKPANTSQLLDAITAVADGDCYLGFRTSGRSLWERVKRTV